jgi:hypothetical protein
MKTHVRVSIISKTFPGVIPPDLLKQERGRRRGKVREGRKGNGIRGEMLPLYPAEEMIRSSRVGVKSTRYAQLNNLIP